MKAVRLVADTKPGPTISPVIHPVSGTRENPALSAAPLLCLLVLLLRAQKPLFVSPLATLLLTLPQGLLLHVLVLPRLIIADAVGATGRAVRAAIAS